MMQVQTFSVVAGSAACNARCPFCVSKMTPPAGVALKEPAVNWRRFEVACRLAERMGATTAMITSKGEPTLFPDQVTAFLRALQGRFPVVEMQSNGIRLADAAPAERDGHLRAWAEAGLLTVAVSVVHHDPEANRQCYVPYRERYIDVPALVGALHDHGLSARITCVAASGGIDSPARVEEMARWAKGMGAEQLTITPVSRPDASENPQVAAWSAERALPADRAAAILGWLKERGTLVLRLAHGALVFDVDGQNVCFNNCLKVDADTATLRNLIFFPDGHLRYYWQHPGAILF